MHILHIETHLLKSGTETYACADTLLRMQPVHVKSKAAIPGRGDPMR
jgi:hypothetical protein